MDYVDAKTYQARKYYDRVVVEYLTDEVMTTDQAVARFVDPIRATFLDGEDVEVLLWAAWRAVIRAAMDYRDAHDRLVALLVGISAQGPLVRVSDGHVCVIWGNLTVFSDLPVFGASMREEINTADNALLDENFVSFAARLTAAGIDFGIYAVWTFRECVKREPVHLTAFRIWHRFGGSELVRRLTELAAAEAPPPADASPEVQKALREAWKARETQPAEREVPEALREAWKARVMQQAAREAPAAREALQVIAELESEER